MEGGEGEGGGRREEGRREGGGVVRKREERSERREGEGGLACSLSCLARSFCVMFLPEIKARNELHSLER